MFGIHSVHKKPKDSRQKLWRYLKFERLVQAIEEEALYFPHISQMSDQWDGLLTKKTKDMLWKSQLSQYNGNIEAANGAVRQYEENRDGFYISSWHMNNYESYLMWKVYADKGCAIQSTYERVSAAFDDSPAKVEGCEIEYIDFERDSFEIGNVYTQIGYKDIPYQDEREFRLIFWKLGLENQKLTVDEKGFKVRVDIKMLIDDIYLNPNHLPEISHLEMLIKEKGLDCGLKNTQIWEKGRI